MFKHVWLFTCFCMMLCLCASCSQKEVAKSSPSPSDDATSQIDNVESPPQTPSKASADDPQQQGETSTESSQTKGQEKSGEQVFAELNSELKTSSQKWRESIAQAKSDEERRKLFSQNPARDLAERFLDFANQFPESPNHFNALQSALSYGNATIKKQAVQAMMERARAVDDPAKADNYLMMVAVRGSGDLQIEAMNRLVDAVEGNPDSELNRNRLETVVKNVRGGPAEPKARAIKLAWNYINDDVTSDQAVEYLLMLAASSNADASSQAQNKLLEHHADRQELIGFMKGMPGRLSQSSHDFLNQICQSGSGEVKANAILTLAKFYQRRDLVAQYYADAPPEQLEMLGDEMVAYIQAERDADETSRLDQWLTDFASEDADLVEQAANQLFALRNLSIGKPAPEITAADLDGKEFSLSDYRGKVVFLDFWGDW